MLKVNVDVVAVAGISVAFEETECVAELLTPSFANVVPLNAPDSAAKVRCNVPVAAVRDQEVSGAVLVLVVIVSNLPFNKRSVGVIVVHVAVNAWPVTLALAIVTARLVGLKVQPDLLGVSV